MWKTKLKQDWSILLIRKHLIFCIISIHIRLGYAENNFSKKKVVTRKSVTLVKMRINRKSFCEQETRTSKEI